MGVRTAHGTNPGAKSGPSGAMGADTSYETLTALNPAHLKALLGQEVVVTLGDTSTRTGIVYNVDPVNFSVALLKPRRPLIKGTQASPKGHDGEDHLCVVPGHAVKGVEVVGGQRAAMECLTSVGAVGWNARAAAAAASPSSPGGLDRFGGYTAGGSSGRRMSLEFLRSYSNASPAAPPAHARRARFSDPGYGEEARGRGDRLMGSIAEGSAASAADDGVARAGREESGWEERRERVRAMLERARVPVHVSAATGAERVPGAAPLVVMGCARVAYPFTADAVECVNEIVLARVRELVSTVQ